MRASPPPAPGSDDPERRSHRLSDLIGASVVDASGRRVGTVSDALVSLGPDYPPVSALLIRAGRGEPRRVAWSQVADLGARRLVLADTAPAGDAGLAPRLLLARDVLDVRVVDVERRRVGRVADVDLAYVGGELRVVAVDIGPSGVLARLGLRRLARRARRDAIDWRAMHLAGGASRVVQLDSPAAAVHTLDPAELAELLARLPASGGAEILDTVDEVRAAAALAATHPALGADLLETLAPERAGALLAALDLPTAGMLLADLAPTRREALMERMGPARARALRDAALAAPAPVAEPRRRWWRVHRGHGRPAP